MQIKALKATQTDIQPFRTHYLQENHFQIRYNACHERGWADAYLLTLNEIPIGYGCITSRKTLLKAGLKEVGFVAKGQIRKSY